MKRNIITIILIFWAFQTFSQHNWGIRLNGGISKIYPIENTQISSEILLSGSFGIVYNYQLYNNFIGVDFIVNQINGDNSSSFTIRDSNYNKRIQQINGKAQLTYFTIPMYFGLKIDNLSVIINISISRLFHQSNILNSEIYDTQNNLLSSKVVNDENIFENNNTTVGLTFTYNFTDRLAAEINYNHGLSNIVDYSKLNWTTQQATIGLRYFLIKPPNTH